LLYNTLKENEKQSINATIKLNQLNNDLESEINDSEIKLKVENLNFSH
ncbi:MAG: hypothetical protein CI947_2074, partial [Halanaerobium sp.]